MHTPVIELKTKIMEIMAKKNRDFEITSKSRLPFVLCFLYCFLYIEQPYLKRALISFA